MTIASEITRLQNDKAAICTAIENKGVTVGNVTLDDYAACIDAIQQGGGGGPTVDLLVVGGGGAGGCGSCCFGGGGGGGGIVYKENLLLTCEIYQVTVGQGGDAKCKCANSGGDSIFGEYIAYGGGGGGVACAGNVGGSGGGASCYACCINCSYKGSSAVLDDFTYQGYAGGNNKYSSACLYCGGGGGGGGGEGSCGSGGDAFQSNISGEDYLYSGGGGGGRRFCNCASGTSGGSGVGGNGAGYNTVATNPTTCGSGGGGGGGTSATTYAATCGNCGVVIVRYPTACGYNMSGGTKYTCGDYTIHCFTSDGAFCIGTPSCPAAGIYHNANRCLITMSSDGTNWLTISDRNLGATSNDINSIDSYGCMYQWGNNYGFSPTGTVTTTTGQVNTMSSLVYCYPGSPYSGEYYRCIYADWSCQDNQNLWGDMSDTKLARKGPNCSGFHVPSKNDISCMQSIYCSLKGSALTASAAQTYFCIPYAGYRATNSTICCQGTQFRLWLSSVCISYSNSYTSQCPASFVACNSRANGMPIRPFKDAPVIPDDTWTKLL